MCFQQNIFCFKTFPFNKMIDSWAYLWTGDRKDVRVHTDHIAWNPSTTLTSPRTKEFGFAIESWTHSKRLNSGNTKVLTTGQSFTFKAMLQPEGVQCRHTNKPGCLKSETFLSGHKMALLCRMTLYVQVAVLVRKAECQAQRVFLEIATANVIEKWQVFCCSPDSSPRLPTAM